MSIEKNGEESSKIRAKEAWKNALKAFREGNKVSVEGFAQLPLIVESKIDPKTQDILLLLEENTQRNKSDEPTLQRNKSDEL